MKWRASYQTSGDMLQDNTLMIFAAFILGTNDFASETDDSFITDGSSLKGGKLLPKLPYILIITFIIM